MEFKEAVTRNLRTSEGLLKFSGRASRAELLWFWLFSMIWTYGSLFLGAIAIAALVAVFGEIGIAVGVAAVLAWYASLFVVAVQQPCTVCASYARCKPHRLVVSAGVYWHWRTCAAVLDASARR